MAKKPKNKEIVISKKYSGIKKHRIECCGKLLKMPTTDKKLLKKMMVKN